MKSRFAGVLVSTFACALALGSSAQAAFPGANGKIAFASDRDVPNPGQCNPYPYHAHKCPDEIYTVNADGTGETNLTNDPADDTEPAWSPDGSRIAFSTNRDGNYEIYTMSADGSGLVRLTHDPGPDHFPSWSPDGSRIVFAGNRSQGGSGIYAMSASDGSAVAQVTSCNKVTGIGFRWLDCERPRWSPDGAEIAFDVPGDFLTCFSCNISNDVYRIKPDGTGLTGVATGGYFSGGFVYPDWSPDSMRLVIEDWDTGGLDLINRDGSGIVQVGVSGDGPIWSPDGQRLTVGYGEIRTSNLDGSSPFTVTHDQALNLWPDWQPIPEPKRGDYKNAA